jgi:putative transposase
LFNVINDFNCEGLAIDVGVSLPSEQVIWSLERIMEWRGRLTVTRYVVIPYDSEFSGQLFDLWAYHHRARVAFR